MHHLSTELAVKQFDADAAFSAALAEFQKGPPEATIIGEARRAAAHGFSWFSRPSEPGFVEVRLRHAGGAEISAEGKSATALLAGLLGHPLAQDIGVLAAAQAAEPEQEAVELEEALAVATQGGAYKAPLITTSAVEAAAESLVAATGGAVITEPSEYVPDLDEAEQARLVGPLTDEQKRACVDGIKLLTAEQRKSFTIAFRDAFKVDREEKAIAPLITQVRHMEFCDRWAIEASGGVAA